MRLRGYTSRYLENPGSRAAAERRQHEGQVPFKPACSLRDNVMFWWWDVCSYFSTYLQCLNATVTAYGAKNDTEVGGTLFEAV